MAAASKNRGQYVSAWIPDEDKAEAQGLARSLGLNMSGLIRYAIKRVARDEAQR